VGEVQVRERPPGKSRSGSGRRPHERDRLRASHEHLRQELELFKRRLFIVKAERVDTRELELEYAQELRELDKLAGTLGMGKAPVIVEDDTPASDGKRRGKRKAIGGRAVGICVRCPSRRAHRHLRPSPTGIRLSVSGRSPSSISFEAGSR
jgi:hypothetical protein